uniref:coiled-coil domain-containing protein 83-like n=1 Tax=Ciona intestinalis TaxID=7719 RepID=UPI000180D114|nr:coiled-coil domain-containing protein 83-like [Ciona intestinalis]XP_018667846.1 coiled-coil domain-containing protein 83-like [Ciona intestinalis]|eukprot:XP_002132030.1 coiled-coil domain-containing protein 83-like [Ciona intestinalis]
MAKKGGKKKGKGGGGKGKKKGEKREDEMTLKEAILAFQIQVKEKASEDLQFEIKGLKDKNRRFRDRNARLYEDQQIHIKTLLRQAKEQEHELEEKEVYNSEHVEQALREKWAAARNEDKELDDLYKRIEQVEQEYAKMSSDVEYWTEYKDVGSEEHAKQIHLLNSELEDMLRNFNDMCGHLTRQLEAAKYEVTLYKEECMAEQQHLASEKAMEHLDPASVQEVHENEWLKKEAHIHREEEKNLLRLLDELESENLSIISELLYCKQEDLKISRNFYMTQFEEDEILNQDTMHDMDLKQMSVYQTKDDDNNSVKAIEPRPMSAMQRAVEQKVFSILPEQEEEEEEWENEIIARQDQDINIYEEKDFLHLGPLEIKLLCVTGESKPIHPLDASLQIVDGSKPDMVTRPKWPIEPPMIRAALENPPELETSST